MDQYDFLAKIILLGESGVGKTMIWNRYFDGRFYDYKSTIGVEFKTKTIDVDGKRGKLQVWDTSGQERFRAISRSYYRNAMGVLLCYAIDKRESFEKVENWLKEVKEYANEKDICIVLAGTKSDLSNERVVSHEEGIKLAETHGMKFFETSAKEDWNINEAFLALAKDINVALNKKKTDAKIDAKIDSVAPSPQLHQRENNPNIQIVCFKCS